MILQSWTCGADCDEPFGERSTCREWRKVRAEELRPRRWMLLSDEVEEIEPPVLSH
jgi:hypothetical protein